MQSFGFSRILADLAALFYPHLCSGCGSNAILPDSGICSRCLLQLPATGFGNDPANPVARIFWGRLKLEMAVATVFFQQKTTVQEILHQIKYHGRQDAARQIGEWMGHQLKPLEWYRTVDWLLPMPLHPRRQASRGFNQASLLCEGMALSSSTPLMDGLLIRKTSTRTQTHQQRRQRWENMQGVFGIKEPDRLQHKHVLLVDDVVTTGATLEAMGQELAKLPGLRLSVCCFAYTLPH